MRNCCRIAVLLLVILGLGSCYWYGQPYLMFDWTTPPDDGTFSTTAPGIPTLVFPAAQYPTEQGRWRATYFHTSPPAPPPPPGYTGWWRWIDFRITAHEGEFMDRGGDSLFEIYLYATGDPTFIQYYSVTGNGSANQAKAAITMAEPTDMSGYEEQTLGTFEQIRGGYRMTGTYGVYVPKK